MVGGGWGNTTVQQASNNVRHGVSNNNTREGGMSTWCGIIVTQDDKWTTTMQGEEQAITMQGKHKERATAMQGKQQRITIQNE